MTSDQIVRPRQPTYGAIRYIKYDIVIKHPQSVAPGKFEWNFRYVIFKRILMIAGWGISCEIALIWMPLDFTDDQSTLVKVVAFCRQATSHYLSQCWPRSLSPYDVIKPQWVKLLHENIIAASSQQADIDGHIIIDTGAEWIHCG